MTNPYFVVNSCTTVTSRIWRLSGSRGSVPSGTEGIRGEQGRRDAGKVHRLDAVSKCRPLVFCDPQVAVLCNAAADLVSVVATIDG